MVRALESWQKFRWICGSEKGIWAAQPVRLFFFGQTLEPQYFSSGDLLADRRVAYAQMLAESGDHAAAADLMQQAVELAGEWLAGLELYSRYLAEAGQIPRAIAVWTRMLALDPDDVFAAGLKLAAHGALAGPPAPALAYVETLFDAYAAEFETALVQKLDYVVPQLIGDALNAQMKAGGIEGFSRGLDLGCGTGLMGERLRAMTSYLEGVDLSEAMVRKAAQKGIYDKTIQAELLHYLYGADAGADLIVAADVFVYVGALDQLFAEVRRVLSPGGLFAFNVEAHDGTEAITVRQSLRFAHSESGILSSLTSAGLDILSIERRDIRLDQGRSIAGYIVVARQPETGLAEAAARMDAADLKRIEKSQQGVAVGGGSISELFP